MNIIHKLVEQYIPLANKIAYQKKKLVPKFIDVEELKSAAYLGLVEAATRFNSTRGIVFSTFAYPRIFGAIQDYLREQGKKREFVILSLDSENDEGFLKDTLSNKTERNDEFFELVSNGLDKQAKIILQYYFVESYSMKEIGDKFNVSESRVSQLIKEYKDKIKLEWIANDLFELAT